MSFDNHEAQLYVDEGYFTVGTWLDEDDDLPNAEAETYIAKVAETFVNNGWPDEYIWPPCSRHRDHPLQVGLIRSAASWYCSKDYAVTVFRLGDLRLA